MHPSDELGRGGARPDGEPGPAGDPAGVGVRVRGALLFAAGFIAGALVLYYLLWRTGGLAPGHFANLTTSDIVGATSPSMPAPLATIPFPATTPVASVATPFVSPNTLAPSLEPSATTPATPMASLGLTLTPTPAVRFFGRRECSPERRRPLLRRGVPEGRRGGSGVRSGLVPVERGARVAGNAAGASHSGGRAGRPQRGSPLRQGRPASGGVPGLEAGQQPGGQAALRRDRSGVPGRNRGLVSARRSPLPSKRPLRGIDRRFARAFRARVVLPAEPLRFPRAPGPGRGPRGASRSHEVARREISRARQGEPRPRARDPRASGLRRQRPAAGRRGPGRALALRGSRARHCVPGGQPVRPELSGGGADRPPADRSFPPSEGSRLRPRRARAPRAGEGSLGAGEKRASVDCGFGSLDLPRIPGTALLPPVRFRFALGALLHSRRTRGARSRQNA